MLQSPFHLPIIPTVIHFNNCVVLSSAVCMHVTQILYKKLAVLRYPTMIPKPLNCAILT